MRKLTERAEERARTLREMSRCPGFTKDVREALAACADLFEARAVALRRAA